MSQFHVTIIQERHFSQLVEAETAADATTALGDQVRARTIEPSAVYISDAQAHRITREPQQEP